MVENLWKLWWNYLNLPKPPPHINKFIDILGHKNRNAPWLQKQIDYILKYKEIFILTIFGNLSETVKLT